MISLKCVKKSLKSSPVLSNFSSSKNASPISRLVTPNFDLGVLESTKSLPCDCEVVLSEDEDWRSSHPLDAEAEQVESIVSAVEVLAGTLKKFKL